ncbi:MAG: DUF4115 domain-containing protein [Chloroflexi bacterium]|nr:DUF4115 domain-containing protein [Chloroflexota bacterium]
MGKLGSWLQSTREAKGVSLLKVEQDTRVRSKVLAALEEGNVRVLPARPYVKGMVRTYAAYLGLDVEEALRLLEEELGPESEYRIQQLPKSIGNQTVITARMMVTIIALVAVTGFFLLVQREYHSLIKAGNVSTAPALSSPVVRAVAEPTRTPTLAPTPSPSPTATPLQEITVEARITGRSWLRVTVDESVAFEGILEAGATKMWQAKDKISLRAGNAGGVEITFNGKRQGSMGSRGEVVDRTWTRP